MTQNVSIHLSNHPGQRTNKQSEGPDGSPCSVGMVKVQRFLRSSRLFFWGNWHSLSHLASNVTTLGDLKPTSIPSTYNPDPSKLPCGQTISFSKVHYRRPEWLHEKTHTHNVTKLTSSLYQLDEFLDSIGFPSGPTYISWHLLGLVPGSVGEPVLLTTSYWIMVWMHHPVSIVRVWGHVRTVVTCKYKPIKTLKANTSSIPVFLELFWYPAIKHQR